MVIKRKIYQEMFEHARKDSPKEACGYLAGYLDVISHIYPMENVDNSNEHFSFEPTEQFEVLKKVKKSGIRIIANYHSHPATPARPSEEDIRLAYDPDIYYFIISLAGEDDCVKAFQIKDYEVNEVELWIVE